VPIQPLVQVSYIKTSHSGLSVEAVLANVFKKWLPSQSQEGLAGDLDYPQLYIMLSHLLIVLR